MSDVKWIKITTSMFEDEKIDFILSLPEHNAILVVWVRLLTMAGKSNSNGYIFLTEQIPYSVEMLAHKFREPLNTVKLAMDTLKKLNMIEYDSAGFLRVTNWEKHQNIDGLDKIREQNRLRNIRYRERQKMLSDGDVIHDVTNDVTVTSRDGTDIDIDIDKEIEKEREKEKSDSDKSRRSVKKKETARSVLAEDKSISEEVRGKLKDFIVNREELKKPMTGLAMKRLIKKLYEITDTDTERTLVLDNSILYGWSGVYPLKPEERIHEVKTQKPQEQTMPSAEEQERIRKEAELAREKMRNELRKNSRK